MKFHKVKESKYTSEDLMAEDDLRALARAKEVEGSPERLAKVKELAKEKMNEKEG